MVGADHNALVEKLKTANINEHPVIPQSDPFYEVLNSPDFIAEYQAIVDELLNNPNATTTAEDYEEYGYSPVAAEVIELFSQSFVRYPIQVKGIDTVIDRYVTTIEASGNVLTKDDKLAIYAGFSTAAFSPRHWATKM